MMQPTEGRRLFSQIAEWLAQFQASASASGELHAHRQSQVRGALEAQVQHKLLVRLHSSSAAQGEMRRQEAAVRSGVLSRRQAAVAVLEALWAEQARERFVTTARKE